MEEARSFLPNDIKDGNRKAVFDIFSTEAVGGGLAKIEAAEKTTMSFVTVGKIIDFFSEVGILSESDRRRDGSGGMGRKRVVYEFMEDSYVSIGVQLVGGRISAVLTNLRGKVIAETGLTGCAAFYDVGFCAEFGNAVDSMRKAAASAGATVVGVGLAVDGAVNLYDKTIRLRTEGSRENDFPYESVLEGLRLRADLPVMLENDVNAQALAETRELEHNGSAVNDLLLIHAGEGIGAGLVLDKKLRRGINGKAGELEYMCFDADSSKDLGAVGWLEASLYGGGEDYTARLVALAVVNIVSVLDVQTVALSGGVLEGREDVVLSKVRGYVERYSGLTPDISVSRLKNGAAAGAALLAMESEIVKIISGR